MYNIFKHLKDQHGDRGGEGTGGAGSSHRYGGNSNEDSLGARGPQPKQFIDKQMAIKHCEDKSCKHLPILAYHTEDIQAESCKAQLSHIREM